MLPPEYSEGIFVVYMIGLSKYFDLILGNNNAIIFNSKYYRTVLYLGLLLGVIAILLNMYLIPKYQIDGTATATLIAVTLYSLAKLLFVVLKMKLFPFTRQTVISLIITIGLYLLFYFWDFSYSPLINIIFKSILLTACYSFLNYALNISADINLVVDGIFKKFRRQ